MELVIGTKKWSTWSMRPWLAIQRSGLAFRETLNAYEVAGLLMAIGSLVLGTKPHRC